MTWPKRVALIHDRLDQDGGAERVLWTLHTMFPEAPIFTSMWNREVVPRFNGCDVRVTWMQRLPGIGRRPRAYAALYPLAFVGLNLTDFDLVISLTSSFAKGIRVADGATHVCYCLSPSNFVWRPAAYFTSPMQRRLASPLLAWLRAWDRWAARQPDAYLANSAAVAKRISSHYGRKARVVTPGVSDSWFGTLGSPGEYYLAVGRLVEQKRLDIAIEACRQLGRPLKVVGTGRIARRLQRVAGRDVSFLGHVPDAELSRLYRGARALLLPAEEDFGLAPLEAQAAGTPVVAYDAGGARETVIEGVTGIRFSPQTAEALADAIRRSEAASWNANQIRSHAAEHAESAFRQEFSQVLGSLRGQEGAPDLAAGRAEA